MARHRRFSYRRLGRRFRYNVAVLVTLVVVTYLLVPWIVSVVDGGRGYNPPYYDPKDQTRQDYILLHGLRPVPVVSPGQFFLDLSLIFLVVIAWATVLPGRR